MSRMEGGFDPQHALRLDGRVALVSGGSRGIGRATSEALAALGASIVIIASRNLDACAALAAEINNRSGRALPLRRERVGCRPDRTGPGVRRVAVRCPPAGSTLRSRC